MNSRTAMMAGALALAIALVVLLFVLLGIGLDDLFATVASTPTWLLAAVTFITFANQLIGVARWRAASRWLNPRAELIGWGQALEATTWGSFLGQIMPLQLAMTAARWTSARSTATIGATLYEQLFDLVILLSGASAAALLLVFGTGPAMAMTIFPIAILTGCLSIRWLLGLGRWIASRAVAGRWPGAGYFARLVDPLERAGKAPAALLASMALWSALRLAILSLRVLLVAVVFLGAIDWATVVIGYPIVGLALGVPLLPGGLGLADWSWTGVLVLAGAAAPAAALTALAARILNFAALLLILLIMTPLSRLFRQSPTVRATNA